MELIAITQEGEPARAVPVLPSVAMEPLKATRELYRKVGFEPPWLGYLAVEFDVCVGTCAFTSPPRNNRVEIAYFTFPGHEGLGIATQMALALVRIALRADPGVMVTAHTLPEKNVSTAVLRKIGFELVAAIDHPEDGRVWEWELGARHET